MNIRYPIYEGVYRILTIHHLVTFLFFKMYLSAVLTFESSIPLLNDTGL